MIDREIEDKLRELGLTCVYQGYFCLLHAVRLAEEDPQRLTLPTKWLYPDVAHRCGITVNQADSALRAAIRRCCRSEPMAVTRMCGGEEAPSVVQFIEGLVRAIQAGRER